MNFPDRFRMTDVWHTCWAKTWNDHAREFVTSSCKAEASQQAAKHVHQLMHYRSHQPAY